MSVWKFFAIKWAALAFSLIALGILWFLVPQTILFMFNLNLVWIAEVWGWIYPFLPSEASLPLDAVEQAHHAITMLVQSMAQILPDTTGLQVEAATRAALGEGWILVAEIALPLRLFWLRRWR